MVIEFINQFAKKKKKKQEVWFWWKEREKKVRPIFRITLMKVKEWNINSNLINQEISVDLMWS
jgi:hypothetical protein